MNKHSLEIPLYLNQKIVFDLLASINDGISQVTKIRTASRSNGEIEAGVDADLGNKNIFTLMAVKLKGKVGTEKNNEQEQEKIHTPSSLFNNLKDRLFKDKMVKKVTNNLNGIQAGEFVEVTGVLKINPLISMMENMIQLMELATAVNGDGTGKKGIDFLDFLDSKGVRFSDVADGKMTLDEFMDILTLDDCINLLGGQPNTGCANTFGMGNLPEYGVPNVMTADGPAGLRILPKCGVNTTAWPCATLLASTWDEELVEKVGKAGAEEVKENNISIWLTPACNIHRSPLCGRNFEYYSEDPYLAGKTGAAMVRGIQSQHIGASVKHFAANNKETNRKDSDSRVSERALREIYLKQFEIIVKEAHPYTIMSSYNLINGIHASENKELLTGILRDEWGFDGLVTTDWWTFGEHYRETKAGNDIKMAAGYPERIKEAYEKGLITEAEIRLSARRILNMILKID